MRMTIDAILDAGYWLAMSVVGICLGIIFGCHLLGLGRGPVAGDQTGLEANVASSESRTEASDSARVTHDGQAGGVNVETPAAATQAETKAGDNAQMGNTGGINFEGDSFGMLILAIVASLVGAGPLYRWVTKPILCKPAEKAAAWGLKKLKNGGD